jgi:capsular exopolysaccharide synthesis family protein
MIGAAASPRAFPGLITVEAEETAVVQQAAPRVAHASDLTAEVFRGIYTRAGAGVSETLAVCSAIGEEGKSTIALGLAITIAQDFPELRVALVETDLTRPVLARDFDVEAVPGLAECLADGEAILLAHRPTSLPNLSLIPAGAGAPGAARLVRSSKMALLLDALRRQHDIIILDVPAVLVNSDALLLGDLADGIVFVVRAGVTPRDLIHKALSQLEPEKIRGIVLNGAHSAVPSRLRSLVGIS